MSPGLDALGQRLAERRAAARARVTELRERVAVAAREATTSEQREQLAATMREGQLGREAQLLQRELDTGGVTLREALAEPELRELASAVSTAVLLRVQVTRERMTAKRQEVTERNEVVVLRETSW